MPYWLPFSDPYVTSKGRLERREMVLLRIRSKSGVEGLGEGVPLSLRGGAELEVVADELEAWGSKAREVGTGFAPLPRSGPARCAVLTAVADASAREAGLPLHAFLSPGSTARGIRCNATLISGDAESVASDARRWSEDGFEDFKLKVGPDSGVEQVRAVRETVGEDARIRLDANGTWPASRAAEFISRIEPFDIELVEQPVPSLEGMASLRRQTGIPLVADEAVSSEAEAAEAARLDACDAVTVKLSKTGSLDPTLGGRLPTYLSSALDGPVGIAAAAHVAVTLPRSGRFSDTAQGLATARLFCASVALEDAPLEGPWLRVPPGHGLGIEIDEDSLREHRL